MWWWTTVPDGAVAFGERRKLKTPPNEGRAYIVYTTTQAQQPFEKSTVILCQSSPILHSKQPIVFLPKWCVFAR